MAILKTNFATGALQKPWLITLLKRVIPPLDKLLLRLSRGWVSTAMQTVVLLETVGAKSGQRRSIVTLCMPDGRDVILVGSNWGQDKHPAWVFNLRARPEAKITFRGYRGAVCAWELAGEERARLWQRLVEYNPHYRHYQETTGRELPIMRLVRSEPGQLR